MKQTDILKSTLNLFLISCLYLDMFVVLYVFLKSSSIVLISIEFVSYVSWKRGAIAGLTLSAFNFLWNTAIFNFLSLGQPFPLEGYISVFVHIEVSLLLGYFGKLSRGVKTNVSVKHIAEPNLPMIFGCPSQLQNAFINFGLNANDAKEEGGNNTYTTKIVEVTHDYCRNFGITCNIGKYVGVAVSDTGTGIELKALSHLFEPFFTTKPEGKGTCRCLRNCEKPSRRCFRRNPAWTGKDFYNAVSGARKGQ
jgi:signal transduction histidine kinase